MSQLNKLKLISNVLLLVFLSAQVAEASQSVPAQPRSAHPSSEKLLEDFYRDPLLVMNSERELPSWSSDRNGNWQIASEHSLQNSQSTQARAKLIDARRAQARRAQQENFSILSQPVRWDSPWNLVDSRNEDGEWFFKRTTIEALDEWKFFRLPEEKTPWSSDYWATNNGMIAHRYESYEADRGKWRDSRQYALFTKPVRAIVDFFLENRDFDDALEDIQTLGPSEKYELLVGDSRHRLTRHVWDWGFSLIREDGAIPGWMGICDGWAAASIMMPRPERKLDLISMENDIPVTMYPADTMALASYLWSAASPNVKFVGGRCNDKDPKRDPESGRVLSEACFNNNPSTWHLAVTNQLAGAGRSFIMDVFWDYEVWNQPLVGYEIYYFNPKDGQRYESIEEAIVSYEDYKEQDNFAKFRNPRAFNHLVGVMMEVTYTNEIGAYHTDTHSAAYDSYKTVTFMYDLELRYELNEDDLRVGDGAIVGGEWYVGRHPDFIWQPSRNSAPRTTGDSSIRRVAWSQEDLKMPEQWRSTASSNLNRGFPSTAIVEALISRTAEPAEDPVDEEPIEEEPIEEEPIDEDEATEEDPIDEGDSESP